MEAVETLLKEWAVFDGNRLRPSMLFPSGASLARNALQLPTTPFPDREDTRTTYRLYVEVEK
jgi:hypothetical protein